MRADASRAATPSASSSSRPPTAASSSLRRLPAPKQARCSASAAAAQQGAALLRAPLLEAKTRNSHTRRTWSANLYLIPVFCASLKASGHPVVLALAAGAAAAELEALDDAATRGRASMKHATDVRRGGGAAGLAVVTRWGRAVARHVSFVHVGASAATMPSSAIAPTAPSTPSWSTRRRSSTRRASAPRARSPAAPPTSAPARARGETDRRRGRAQEGERAEGVPPTRTAEGACAVRRRRAPPPPPPPPAAAAAQVRRRASAQSSRARGRARASARTPPPPTLHQHATAATSAVVSKRCGGQPRRRPRCHRARRCAARTLKAYF